MYEKKYPNPSKDLSPLVFFMCCVLPESDREHGGEQSHEDARVHSGRGSHRATSSIIGGRVTTSGRRKGSSSSRGGRTNERRTGRRGCGGGSSASSRASGGGIDTTSSRSAPGGSDDERWWWVGGAWIVKGADAKGDIVRASVAVGLGRVGRRCGLAVCGGNGETSRPGLDVLVGVGELVEVDGRVGRDFWAWVGEDTVDCTVLLGRNGGEVDHGEIAASHELDGHVFPHGVGVGISFPGNSAGLASAVDSTGAGFAWRDDGAHGEGGGEGEQGCEGVHYD